MGNSEDAPKITTWSFVSPETFELTLRRLMEPSAEAKLREALHKVLTDIEDSKTGPMAERRAAAHEAARLQKERERLERRLAKLRQLKNMGLVPLIFGLLFAAFVWLLAFGATVAGGLTIQQALAKDMENVKENQATGLTIQELDEDLHAGQLMGVPPESSKVDGVYTRDANDKYPAPEYLIQVTNWAPELNGCEKTLANTNYDGGLESCVAAARIDLVKQDQPEITESCLFLQLTEDDGSAFPLSEDEQIEFLRALRINSDSELRYNPIFYPVKGEEPWNASTLLTCEVFGTDDESIASELSYIVGQAAYRINSQLYLAGGIFTWLEEDGSYAPRSQWDGHRSSSTQEE